MKKTIITCCAIFTMAFYACTKSNEDSQISLAASATQVVVGQQASVSLTTNANLSNWTVTPAAAVNKTFELTTSKINYFTFTQPGVYTIAVSTKNVAYDSTRQSINAAWNAVSRRGGCKAGIDTASVQITVTSK